MGVQGSQWIREDRLTPRVARNWARRSRKREAQKGNGKNLLSSLFLRDNQVYHV